MLLNDRANEKLSMQHASDENNLLDPLQIRHIEFMKIIQVILSPASHLRP